jgi:hypothetical protein
MQLEIAELDISQLQLEGSLLITAEDAIGHTNGRRQLSYSHNIGKCTLKNVQVGNKGIDRSAGNQYWKNQINRLECLRIHIEGSGEFYADNVHFEGDQTIVVPDGIKTTAFMRDGKLALRQDKIDQPTWSWHYHFDENDRIVLKREEKAR